jgi:hypothetical protein
MTPRDWHDLTETYHKPPLPRWPWWQVCLVVVVFIAIGIYLWRL